jgi:Uma2 family endonuclease
VDATPDQKVADLRAKCRLYRARGVDLCWLVHPDERWAESWDASNDGVRLAPQGALESAVLPGFRLSLAQLWAAIDTAPA